MENFYIRDVEGKGWRWIAFRSDFVRAPEADVQLGPGCGHIDCSSQCGGDYTHETCPHAKPTPSEEQSPPPPEGVAATNPEGGRP